MSMEGLFFEKALEHVSFKLHKLTMIYTEIEVIKKETAPVIGGKKVCFRCCMFCRHLQIYSSDTNEKYFCSADDTDNHKKLRWDIRQNGCAKHVADVRFIYGVIRDEILARIEEC